MREVGEKLRTFAPMLEIGSECWPDDSAHERSPRALLSGRKLESRGVAAGMGMCRRFSGALPRDQRGLMNGEARRPQLAALPRGYGLSSTEIAVMTQAIRVLATLHEVDTLRWATEKNPNRSHLAAIACKQPRERAHRSDGVCVSRHKCVRSNGPVPGR